jgi:AhpD family alkylhydroperoxidase
MTTSLDGEWGDCLVEPQPDAELEAYSRKALGARVRAVQYVTPCPWLARGLGDLGGLGRSLEHVDFELYEAIFMAVSQDNSCRYCFDSHRALLRLGGFSDERIRKLEEEGFAVGFDQDTRAVVEFARLVSRSSPLPTPADRVPLRLAGYNDEAIDEIVLAAAVTCAGNRVPTLLALPSEPIADIAQRWYISLLVPFTRLLLRRLSSRPARPLPETQRTGPFAPLLLRLSSPGAVVVERVMDEAWQSQILPRRTKALIFAVVAHTLGCPVSKVEALRLLRAEGLDAARVEEILAHLGSPALDSLESEVVPFARETVWYQVEQMQRKTRALAEKLTPPQLLEVVGFAAFSNLLCRLAIAGERSG